MTDKIAEERLTRLLIEVGDSGEIKRAMDGIVVVILKDLHTMKPIFLSSLIACITEIPMKTTIYGCLTGLLNLRDSSLVGLVVEETSRALEDAVRTGDFKSMKLLLRYFGELVNAGVITGTSYLDLIANMLVVISSNGVKPQLIDAIVSVVLGALPWASYHLSHNDPDGLQNVVSTVDMYITRRRESLLTGSLGEVFDALKVYRDCPNNEPYVQIDRLEHLWSQILDLQANNWDECLLMRPENTLFEELSTGTKHALRDFAMPSNFHLTDIPEQEPLFWVFDDSVNTAERTLAELPSTSKIERYIMDDIATDTIHLLSHNHIECSHFLLNIDKFHKETDYNFYQAVVENLIRELIKLPHSQELGIYYATLLFDLCKGAPGKVPSAMGRAVRIIFSRLDGSEGNGGGMDVECVGRLSEWFSHHLSNFNYTWKWADWAHVLDDETSAKFAFVRETLEQEIRFSYYDRILGTLPESFTNNKSVFPVVAPTHEFKYGAGFNSGDEDFNALITRLNRQMVNKGEHDSVVSILEDLFSHRLALQSNAMATEDYSRPGPSWDQDAVVRDIFVQNVLFLGTKSFSHFLNVVERYVKILQQINVNPEDKLQTVKIIAAFWQGNPQNLEICLDKLMNYRVVDPPSIITWVLDVEFLESNYSRWYVWTILRNVVGKANSKVSQLREKLGVNAMEEDDNSQESLDGALRDQKAAFILAFQKFQFNLKHLLEVGEVPGVSAKWRWVSGQMREFGRTFHKEINRLKFTLEAIAFVEPVEPNAAKIWSEIKAVGELLVKA
ncbi:UNVERIFIED_CONTAM: Nuclear cap-binding protein subunit 1 [Siphonaria sp. JEL0065]|nr:Nuclear cap-binding protein subunit 1 [Siphonaria sp. JEL0065]